MRRSLKLRTEISIVPVINLALFIILVLLVIAPFLGEGNLKIDLPEANKKEIKKGERVVIMINKEDEIVLDETVVSFGNLRDELRAKILSRPLVVIKADKDIPYKKIEYLLSVAKECGARRTAIATQPWKEEEKE